MPDPSPYAVCNTLANGEEWNVGGHNILLNATNLSAPVRADGYVDDQYTIFWQGSSYVFGDITVSVWDITSSGARVCIELPHIDVAVPPITLSVNVAAGKPIPAVGNPPQSANILISLNSTGTTNGQDAHILISNGPVSPPASSLVTVHVVDSVTQQPINHAHIVLNLKNMGETNSDGNVTIPTAQGTTVPYDVTASGYQDIHSTTPIPNPTWYIAVSMSAVGAPPPVQPPPGGQPPPVGIEECVFPTLSLNFIQVISDMTQYVSCRLGQSIAHLAGIGAALAGIAQSVLHLPDMLDAWISRLFGIDPALPFWPEVEKKMIAMIQKAVNAVWDAIWAEWPEKK